MLPEDVDAMEEWERIHITWGDWARGILLIIMLLVLLGGVGYLCTHQSALSEPKQTNTTIQPPANSTRKIDHRNEAARYKAITELDKTIKEQEEEHPIYGSALSALEDAPVAPQDTEED